MKPSEKRESLTLLFPQRVHLTCRDRCGEEKRAFARKLSREQTEAEQVLWNRLKQCKTGFRFKRQQVMFGWIVDFYCGIPGVVIEVDGEIHDRTRDRDAHRDRVMRDYDLVVLRFTNDQVMRRTDWVVDEIMLALARLGYYYPDSPPETREVLPPSLYKVHRREMVRRREYDGIHAIHTNGVRRS